MYYVQGRQTSGIFSLFFFLLSFFLFFFQKSKTPKFALCRPFVQEVEVEDLKIGT